MVKLLKKKLNNYIDKSDKSDKSDKKDKTSNNSLKKLERDKKIVKILNCTPATCPYLPKKVLTNRQAIKQPIGSFYHPTKETYRSGACDIGFILKKGYERRAYRRKDGTFVKATYVDPVCIHDKGIKGKLLDEFKPIHLSTKNELKPYGYVTKLKNYERLNALLRAAEKLSFKTVILRISALRTLQKNNPPYYKIYNEDLKNLQLMHKLYKIGYQLNKLSKERINALKMASIELNIEKVISLLYKLKKIYIDDKSSSEIINRDIKYFETK